MLQRNDPIKVSIEKGTIFILAIPAGSDINVLTTGRSLDTNVMP